MKETTYGNVRLGSAEKSRGGDKGEGGGEVGVSEISPSTVVVWSKNKKNKKRASK